MTALSIWRRRQVCAYALEAIIPREHSVAPKKSAQVCAPKEPCRSMLAGAAETDSDGPELGVYPKVFAGLRYSHYEYGDARRRDGRLFAVYRHKKDPEKKEIEVEVKPENLVNSEKVRTQVTSKYAELSKVRARRPPAPDLEKNPPDLDPDLDPDLASKKISRSGPPDLGVALTPCPPQPLPSPHPLIASPPQNAGKAAVQAASGHGATAVGQNAAVAAEVQKSSALDQQNNALLQQASSQVSAGLATLAQLQAGQVQTAAGHQRLATQIGAQKATLDLQRDSLKAAAAAYQAADNATAASAAVQQPSSQKCSRVVEGVSLPQPLEDSTNGGANTQQSTVRALALAPPPPHAALSVHPPRPRLLPRASSSTPPRSSAPKLVPAIGWSLWVWRPPFKQGPASCTRWPRGRAMRT